MNPLIITIGREYGSGGHNIGKIVAEKLNMRYYDIKLLTLSAEKSGHPESVVAIHDGILQDNNREEEEIGDFAFKNTLIRGFSRVEDEVFISQAQVIRKIASNESAVIIGRCADYILSQRDNTFHIYIHAPLDFRIARVMERDKLNENDALKTILKSDKARGNYYFRYTNLKWGRAQNYDICINSASVGIENSAEILVDLVQRYRNKLSKEMQK